jgi:hypothetical protein
LIIAFFGACAAGCGNPGAHSNFGAPGPTGTPTPTPAPTPPPSLSNLTAFCQGAPAITLPGTYPIFENEGVLSGTTYTIDPSESEFLYVPLVAGPSEPPYTIPPSATPNPSASPVDVWSGTVTYTGTPHDSTICFLAAAYVSRAPISSPNPDNAEALGDPEYQTSVEEAPSPSPVPDTVENFSLTITNSSGSGSFDLAGGGHASITITAHGTISDDRYRKLKQSALRSALRRT